MRRASQRSFALLLSTTVVTMLCAAAQLPEYQLKAAFLYNFAQFTEWPVSVGKQLNLCIYGGDPFGADLDDLAGKPVGGRSLVVQRRVSAQMLPDCHVLYVSRAAIGELAPIRQQLAGRPVLIVTDSPAATRAGSTINMTVAQNRVTFEANRKLARESGLDLSSRLLRLATEVIQ
jgi:hypothetical protein